MNFYFFDKDDGFEYFALIYAINSDEASKKYQNEIDRDNRKPKLIDNLQALELICCSNLDEREFDETNRYRRNTPF